MSPRLKRIKFSKLPSDWGHGDEPWDNSNTSTYIVACLTEIRVSARSERDAYAVAMDEWAAGEEDVRKVSFRIEDQPGSSRCWGQPTREGRGMDEGGRCCR